MYRWLSTNLQVLLWPAQEPTRPIASIALSLARYLYALARDLSTGELNLRAMSLVYTTMWAVVPLLAFSFAIAKGLGLHRDLEPMLISLLQPLGPRAEEISGNVVAFVDNISGSVLASVSVVLLLITAFSMAQKIESSFNHVWRVDRPRSLARQFSEYISIIFVGPLVMIVAAGLIASLSSTAIVQRLQQMEPVGSWLAQASDAMPYGLVVVAFWFLYIIIPNTHVRIRPALGGALFGGIVWAASGQLFTRIIVNSTRFEAIYSGFAIVIVLMLWLYLSWLILLVGLQLAFYLQNPYHLRYGQRTEPMSNELRERLAINAMLLVGRDFEKPEHGWRTESLAAQLRVPRSALEPIVAMLTDHGLVTQSADSRLIPARDPRRITVADIVATVRRTASRNLRPDWNPTVDELANRVDAAIDAALGGYSLADLVDQDLAGSDTGPGGEQTDS